MKGTSEREAPSAREIVVIEAAAKRRPVDWGELWQYRDLFYFLVWRDIKSRYAQSILGVGWAVLQPVFSMIVFTVVFGNLAKIRSDGVPYALFSFAALVPWTYFATALTASGTSLTAGSGMLTKVYFPRLVFPLGPVLSKLVDFLISLLVLFVLMAFFRVPPTWGALALPLLIALMMLSATGLGMWVAALSIQYRDLKYAMTFFVQLFMYAAPVVYPTSMVPERFRLLYALNPMVGVIEGFRAGLLGTRPMPWSFLAVGSVTALVLAITGTRYFRRMEARFADVV